MPSIKHVPRSIALLCVAGPQDWASLILALLTKVREAATALPRTAAALTTRTKVYNTVSGICAMQVTLDTVTLQVANSAVVLRASLVRTVLAIPTLAALAQAHPGVTLPIAITLKLA